MRGRMQSARQARLLRIWRARSLRLQIVSVLLLINMAAVVASFAVVIRMAQNNALSEIEASMELAELYVREAISNIKSDIPWQSLAASLPLALHTPRHVRLMIADAAGVSLAAPTPQFDAARPEAPPLAPSWFGALFDPANKLRSVRVVLDGRRITTVVIAATPELMIADVWAQIKAQGLLALIINIAIIGSVYGALGRILKPVSRLGAGLRELGQGHFRVRLDQPEVRELGALVSGFNALAESLEAARAQNSRLTRHLLTVQDDERRQIAMELHDEAGPCLFGVKASAASLERFAAGLSASDGEKLRERVASIIGIADRLQSMNRRLLRNLRPTALGRVSLGELLTDLMLRFEREHGDVRFSLELGTLSRTHGEATDLAVYRSIQEGLANALRHAGACGIAVSVDEEDGELRVAVQDDGRGLPGSGMQMGLGLTGVRERVGALGGECRVENARPRGARLSIVIPVGEQPALETINENNEMEETS
jgi:two-component system, NarL family, sensor histidine kinase UhpB